MLIDTHCHLGDQQFDADRSEVVARAAANGVLHVVVVADSADATVKCIELADEPGLSATAGVHPHSASTWNDEVHARLAAAASNPVVVAVGET
ncbi:MAG: TatD family hydrolase, partial [Gemmatimonadales bacterium]